MSLLACGDTSSDEIRAGIAYLLAHQLPEGAWKDDSWTGTGFPEVFYLDYHLYATYFPLLALETWRKARQVSDAEICETAVSKAVGAEV